jgi:hypothetical protein
MAVIGELLFWSGGRRATLSDALRHNLEENVPAEVEKLSGSLFQSKTDEELVATIVQRCRANPLVLKVDEAKGDAQPKRMSMRDLWGDDVTVDGLKITQAIPFDGDRTLFELQPNRFDMSPPRGEVRGNTVVIGMEVAQAQADNAVQYIEETRADIQKYIDWQAPTLAEHNAALAGAAAAAIQRRRATLGKASDIASRLSGR